MRLIVLALAASMALAGCLSDSTNSSGVAGPGGSESRASPSDASTVSNNPGAFSWSGAMAFQTDTRTHAWVNPVPLASVSWSGAVGGGSFVLTITDQAGTVVYERTIDGTQAGAFDQPSTPGLPGTWTITAELSDFTGSMALSINSGP